MAKWLGFAIEVKEKDKRPVRLKDKYVIRSSAEQALEMYKKIYPDADAYVVEVVRGEYS